MPTVSVIIPCYHEQATIRLLPDALREYAFPHAVYVDILSFGSFRHLLVGRIGRFNEFLLTGEGNEFSVRLRKAGGRICLDPSIRTVYFARPTLRERIRQYWRYGFWKRKMFRRYPDTLRRRQALSPLSILTWLGLGLSSIIFPFARLAFTGARVAYFPIMLLAGFYMAILVMRLTWGSGFSWSTLGSSFGKNG